MLFLIDKFQHAAQRDQSFVDPIPYFPYSITIYKILILKGGGNVTGYHITPMTCSESRHKHITDSILGLISCAQKEVRVIRPTILSLAGDIILIVCYNIMGKKRLINHYMYYTETVHIIRNDYGIITC